MSMVLGGMDVVGDEMDGEDGVSGAAYRSRLVRVPTPRWMRGTTTQGVSRPQEEMDFLPFESVTLPAGAVGVAGVLIATPQRPFRGERLIMEAIDTATGLDVSGAVVINPAIYVGAVQVGSSQGAAPIRVFSATAFGVRLSVPAAGQGTLIKIFVQSTIALLNDAIVTATLIGRAMR